MLKNIMDNSSGIVKIRKVLVILIGIVLFVGAQIVPATKTGEVQNIFEATGMAVFVMGLHFVIWSRYVYVKILEDGVKISYEAYQLIGLIIVSGTLWIVLNAYFLSKM